MNKYTLLIIIVAIATVILLTGTLFTVKETDQVIITQFGKPVSDPIVDAGLHFKIPFIQKINRFEKRILEWDGQTSEMPTKDKTYIIVDIFGRWRISDANQYFLRLRDERSSLSRLDDILGSETRNAIANHELIEVIRTTKGREPYRDPSLAEVPGIIGMLYPIEMGRAKIEAVILNKAAAKLVDFGIELLDVRFKRINYNESVRKRIYDRMISERQQIAERFISEGAGEAAKITGKRERDLQKIESEAYKAVQEISGRADAIAAEIYANAYNQTPIASEFYEFVKTLETYEMMLKKDTTLILTTDSDVFKFFKSINPDSNRSDNLTYAQDMTDSLPDR
ncbi:MAG: protease modulator HflC [Candidatus Omnitrophota bacterium]|jgi:membrane protease subunit HflC|nr:MAG: protease modulator HflC [Candidatus Omnitrophota bacterium]